MLQAIVGLALVMALIFLCAWVARRFGLSPTGNARVLKVVSSTMVGQRERVVVVEIGDTWLLLGVAPGQVRALHTVPVRPLPDEQTTPALNLPPALSAFSQNLQDSLGKLRFGRKPD